MTDRGYGRISLDTARSGSIAKQHERIKAFASTDFEWYADESVSGSKVRFSDRPDGSRLLADLQPGDRVLVTKIDRAARSVRDLLDLVETIDQRQASIVFVDQNIDTSGPMGRFILTLLGAIAELEAAIIAERRRESLESFAKEGRHAVGKAPFGFVSVDNPDGRGLVIRPAPETVDLAREAVERIMAGESQEKVRRLVGLSKTGMHRWLRNPRLAGMTPNNGGVVTIDGQPRVDPDAALLTMVEWRELQSRLTPKGEKSWSPRAGYGAALRCGECGQRLYINISKRTNADTGLTHDTYVCRKDKHAPGQRAPSIMTHRANAYIEERFLSEVGDRQALVGSWSDSLAAKSEAVAAAEVRLEEAQRRFSAAVTDEEEDEALSHQRAAKRALRDAQALQGERVFRVEETGRTVRQVWEVADYDERCALLSRLGTWTLHFGRAPVEQRLLLEPNEMLLELVTQHVGSESEGRDDRGGFLLP